MDYLDNQESDIITTLEQRQIAQTIKESAEYLKRLQRVIEDLNAFNERARDYLNNSAQKLG